MCVPIPRSIHSRLKAEQCIGWFIGSILRLPCKAGIHLASISFRRGPWCDHLRRCNPPYVAELLLCSYFEVLMFLKSNVGYRGAGGTGYQTRWSRYGNLHANQHRPCHQGNLRSISWGRRDTMLGVYLSTLRCVVFE